MRRLRLTAILTALSGAVFIAKGLWIPVKAELAYGLMDRAFDDAVAEQAPAKPWSWADFAVIGKLLIRGEFIHVLDQATGQSMAFGAGRHEEYAPEGPLVISGHRDTHFSVLQAVEIGEQLTFHTLESAETYKVTDTRIYDLREGVLLPPSVGQMMLITCWPFDGIDPGTSKRYLVLAEKQPDERRTIES